MKNFLLLLSTIITAGAVIPYARDILKGKTKPNIVSWITWTLLTALSTAALLAAGEYRAAFFTGTAMLETALVVALGLRYGYVKYTRFDVVCQVATLVGLVLWQFFDTPFIAIFASVVIDLIGCLPTVRHSWQKPYEETWTTFAWCSLGAFIALFAIDSYNWTALLYPLYLVVINFSLTVIILFARNSLVNKKAPSS